MKKLLLFFVLISSLSATSFASDVFAHKPELVSEYSSQQILVENPEVSKAYYGVFDSTVRAQEFVIESDTEFELYANFLLPVNGNSVMDKRMTMQIFKGDELLTVLSGAGYEWTEFFEPFGYDDYLMGPEFESQVEPGRYKIVLSMDEGVELVDGEVNSYSVAIGKIEDFGFEETIDTYRLIPKIKSQIFDKTGADFVLSPLGAFLVLILVVFGFLSGYLIRFLYSVLGIAASCGINKNGRVLRGLAAVLILFLSLFFGFNKTGFFISGLVLFESVKGFCFVRFLMKN